MIKIMNGTFDNVGTAVSLANGSNVDVEMSDVAFKNCVKCIEERDPPSFLASLGLPAETPVEHVLDVIRALREKPGSTPAEQHEIVKESKLWPFAERAANVIGVIQGLVSIAGAAIGIPAAF